MTLTDSQAKHLRAIVTQWEANQSPPTAGAIHNAVYQGRRHTRSATSRAVNELEAAGYITVTHSPAVNAEVLTPTHEGRNALPANGGTA